MLPLIALMPLLLLLDVAIAAAAAVECCRRYRRWLQLSPLPLDTDAATDRTDATAAVA